MTQTAIQEAIEKIKTDAEHRHEIYQSAAENAIKILTKLLPKERQDFIDAYDTAKYKQESDPDGGAGMGCYYVEEKFGI